LIQRDNRPRKVNLRSADRRHLKRQEYKTYGTRESTMAAKTMGMTIGSFSMDSVSQLLWSGEY
jgi:hypothetical protein